MSTEAIEKLTIEVHRIADVLERAFPLEVPPTEQELADLAKLDDEAETYAAAEAREVTMAVVEMIEGRGDKVPDTVYKRLGIDPPARKLATPPSAEVLNAAQPGAQTDLPEPGEPLEPPRPAEPPDPNKSEAQ